MGVKPQPIRGRWPAPVPAKGPLIQTSRQVIDLHKGITVKVMLRQPDHRLGGGPL